MPVLPPLREDAHRRGKRRAHRHACVIRAVLLGPIIGGCATAPDPAVAASPPGTPRVPSPSASAPAPRIFPPIAATSAEAWAVDFARALNEEDWLACRSLLHLPRDLRLAPVSQARFREGWLQALRDHPAAPGAELLEVCAKERKSLPIRIGDRDTRVDFEERVTLVFRGSGGQCFSMRIDDILRHPEVGWVGVTPGVTSAPRACPAPAETPRPGCAGGSRFPRRGGSRSPGPPAPASAAEWLVRLVLATSQGDTAGMKGLLHLDALGSDAWRRAELRRGWLERILQVPFAPEITVMAVCTTPAEQGEAVDRGRPEQGPGIARVRAFFREGDGRCFEARVSDVIQLPGVGWVGMDPDLRRDPSVPCLGEDQVRKMIGGMPGCHPARLADDTFNVE